MQVSDFQRNKRSRSIKKESICIPCKGFAWKKKKSAGGEVCVQSEDLPKHAKYFIQKSTSAVIKSVVALCTLILFIN